MPGSSIWSVIWSGIRPTVFHAGRYKTLADVEYATSGPAGSTGTT
jgi:hypothetical protein